MKSSLPRSGGVLAITQRQGTSEPDGHVSD